jgi:alkaline phosphatase D
MSRVTALESLVTGLPSTTSKAATVSTIAINAILVVFALDLVLRGSIYPASELAFSRVGYVSPTTAKILVREPRHEVLPLHLWYHKLTDGKEGAKVEAAVLHSLNDSTDFTSPFTLTGLEPSTSYRYSLSNDLSGEFTTAPPSGSDRLTFVTSSCIKANFPYNPLSHPLRIPGLELMSRGLANFPTISPPAFMLFLGDFIYIDVPVRFGSSVSVYRREYQKVYLSPSWKASSILANLPWIHTLDDHEIANDWASGNTTAPFPAAVDPYHHYHVSVNPPIPGHPFAIPANTTYFSFTNGPASFFMLDNRAYRTPPSLDNSTMLGSAQLQSMLDYISQPEPEGVKWKIVSSSVPFTKNWRVGTPDTWGGYLKERRAILEAMWKAERELGLRIVLLSGDRHEFGATRFPDPFLASSPDSPETFSGPGRGIHEFCVGPLSQFYFPFRSYRQEDDDDVQIKYTPDGNFKFGAVEIDTQGGGADRSSDLIYSLYINGEVVWKYRLSVPFERSKEGDVFPPGEVLLDNVDYWTGFERVFGPGGRMWNAGWVRKGLGAVLGSERLDEA